MRGYSRLHRSRSRRPARDAARRGIALNPAILCSAILCSAILYSAILCVPQNSHAEATHIAVIPLLGNDEVNAATTESLTQSLMRALNTTEGFAAEMLSRRRAPELLRCVQKQPCLKQLGLAERATHFIAGQVARLGSNWHLDLWLFSVETGAVARSGTARGRNPETLKRRLQLLIPRLVDKLSPIESDAAARATPQVERRTTPQTQSSTQTQATDPASTTHQLKHDYASVDAGKNTGAEDHEQRSRDKPSIWGDLRFWAWIGSGVTVIAIGAAVGFGVAALSSKSNAEVATYQGKAALEHDAAKKNALAANILFGISGALALATGTVFYLAYLRDSPPPESPQKAIRALAWAPAVLHGGGGLLLEGRF